MNINYVRIVHFLTIVKYMNMNKAAQELYITQPALSLSISRMENDLGITLFYRDKNKLVLTKEAEQLLPYFKQIRHDYQILENEIEQLKTPKENIVNVSFSGSNYFFSTLYMSSNINSYKEAEVHLSYVNSQQARDGMLAGYIDFAIAAPPIKHSKITTINLFTESIGVVMPQNHPFATHTCLSLNDISNLTFHGLFKDNSFRQICDTALRAHQIEINYATENNYISYMKLIENNDNSCSFFSTRLNFEQTFNNNISMDYVYLPIENDPITRTMGISYLTNGKAQYKFAHLLDYLKDYIPYLSNHYNTLGKTMSSYFEHL